MRTATFALALALVAAAACSDAGSAQAPPDLGTSDWEPDCQLGERDDPAVRNAAWAERERSEPICLFAGAMAWAGHDAEKAKELYALAMVRRRYDTGRCVTPPAGELSSMMAAVRMGAGQVLAEKGVMVGPDQIRPVALKDASYAYRTDHLTRMCDGQVKPVSAWPAVRKQMVAELKG